MCDEGHIKKRKEGLKQGVNFLRGGTERMRFTYAMIAITFTAQIVQAQSLDVSVTNIEVVPDRTVYEHCVVFSNENTGGCFVEEIAYDNVSIYAEEHVVQALNTMYLLEQMGEGNIYALSSDEYFSILPDATGGFVYDVRSVDPDAFDFDITAWGSAARDAAHHQVTGDDLFRITTPTDPLTSRCVVAVGSAIAGGAATGVASTWQSANIWLIGSVSLSLAVGGGLYTYSTQDCCNEEAPETVFEEVDPADYPVNTTAEGGSSSSDGAETESSDAETGSSSDADNTTSQDPDVDAGEENLQGTDNETATTMPNPEGDVVPDGDVDLSPFGPYGPDIDTGEIVQLNIQDVAIPVEEGGCGLGAVTIYRFNNEPLVDRTRGLLRDSDLDPWILTDEASLDIDLGITEFNPTTTLPIFDSLIQPPDVLGGL